MRVYRFQKHIVLPYSTRDTHTKIGTIQKILVWPLRKDDTQNHEAFHILNNRFWVILLSINLLVVTFF